MKKKSKLVASFLMLNYCGNSLYNGTLQLYPKYGKNILISIRQIPNNFREGEMRTTHFNSKKEFKIS